MAYSGQPGTPNALLTVRCHDLKRPGPSGPAGRARPICSPLGPGHPFFRSHTSATHSGFPSRSFTNLQE